MLRHRWVLVLLLATMTGLSAWSLLGGSRGAFTGPGFAGDEGDSIFEEMLDEFGVNQSECLLVIEGDDLLGPEQVALSRRFVAAVEAVDHVAQVLWGDDVPRFVAPSWGSAGRW